MTELLMPAAPHSAWDRGRLRTGAIKCLNVVSEALALNLRRLQDQGPLPLRPHACTRHLLETTSPRVRYAWLPASAVTVSERHNQGCAVRNARKVPTRNYGDCASFEHPVLEATDSRILVTTQRPR